MNKKTKRGRKARKLNLNFGGKPFTVNQVVARYKNTKFENGNKGITAVAVFQRLTKMVKARTAKIVGERKTGSKGRPATTYLVLAKA